MFARGRGLTPRRKDAKENSLYGSYAQGEKDRESDRDVLLVLEHTKHYATEVGRKGDMVAGLSLEHGSSISRNFASKGGWSAGEAPYLENAREEATPA